MEEKILELIYNYSKSGRIIDKIYIDTVVDIVVNFMSLNSYVNKINYITDEEMKKPEKNCIKLTNTTDFADLSYNFESHTIDVYTDNILKSYARFDKINICEGELKYFKTILYTQMILHELEHANQSRIIAEEKNLESKLLSQSIPFSFDTFRTSSKEEVALNLVKMIMATAQYIYNYKYAPHERMAEIDSSKKILEIISIDKINLPKSKQYFEDQILKHQIEAYEDTFCPTIKYLSGMTEVFGKNPLTVFDWYYENEEECLRKSIELYSFEQRIRFGLPLEEEKKRELLRKFKLNNYD